MPRTAVCPQVLFLAAAIAAAPMLQGCLVAAAGAGAGAGYELSQERSINDQIKDTAIGAAITASWRQYEPKLAENCSVTVYQGRVLLTGRAPSEQWHDIATKLAWQQKEVKEVYNEIEIGQGDDFAQRTHDAVVSTKLKAALIADGDVRSVNYDATTENSVVYLMGSARSRAELDAVSNHARNIEGVRRVVSFVRIRSGAPQPASSAAAAPPPSAAPEAPPAETPPPPTARQPVQATPLK
ncbi:MAG TPA: BON domain-containing protein [Stellaceae bacterium]|nr:BON domain-containing protein [Stellaceae bacterium]